MAPDGHMCATVTMPSTLVASGSSHAPCTLALNTPGSPSTQCRAWMQRRVSYFNVTALPSTCSTPSMTVEGGIGRALAGALAEAAADAGAAIGGAPGPGAITRVASGAV